MGFFNLNNISISYNDNIVLDSISLSISKGEFVGLMGNNGSGKSSLLKLISGELEEKNGGNIVFEDVDVTHMLLLERLRKGIVYIHQFPITFPDIEAWENFAIWRSAITDNSLLIGQRKETIEFLNRKLDQVGFKIPLQKRVRSLSETQNQILEFLRFFLVDAKLVLIDEATSILDIGLSNKILDFLKVFTLSGGSVIFVSHRIGEMKKYADLIFSIEDKRVQFFSKAYKKIAARAFNTAAKKNESYVDRALYNLKIQVLRGRNLQINLYARRIIGITGLDGSAYENIGESILLNLKQSRNNENRLLRLGKDFSFLGKNRNTDWVFQGKSISFNLSVAKDKKFFAASNSHSGIEDDVRYYKIEPPIKGMVVDELSGGNRLKTAIARTLIQHCPIVILDEPFTGIDDISCTTLINIILNESKNRESAFIILSKDYLRLIGFCDELVTIKNDGSHNYFLSENFKNIEAITEEQLFN